MFYSCCKQIVGKHRRPTSMQRLTRGSVICFGSTVDGTFCVDTVLVVASAERWTAVDVGRLEANEAFIMCTAGAIANSPDAEVGLTLYRGATIERPVDDMFSFVPARRVDDAAPRFPRPPINMPGLINPANRQSTWGSKRPLDIETVRAAWGRVRDQVIEAGLVPAISLEVPGREDAGETLRAGGRDRC
jgi:hypothetical protein